MRIRGITACESNLSVCAASPLIPISRTLQSRSVSAPLEMWCSVALVVCGFSALVQGRSASLFTLSDYIARLELQSQRERLGKDHWKGGEEDWEVSVYVCVSIFVFSQCLCSCFMLVCVYMPTCVPSEYRSLQLFRTWCDVVLNVKYMLSVAGTDRKRERVGI